jgi:hypothetical protein
MSCLLTWLVSWRLAQEGRQEMIRKQLIILLASIAAALSLANFGGGSYP